MNFDKMSAEEIGQEYAYLMVIVESNGCNYFGEFVGKSNNINDKINQLEDAYWKKEDAESLNSIVESYYEMAEENGVRGLPR